MWCMKMLMAWRCHLSHTTFRLLIRAQKYYFSDNNANKTCVFFVKYYQ